MRQDVTPDSGGRSWPKVPNDDPAVELHTFLGGRSQPLTRCIFLILQSDSK